MTSYGPSTPHLESASATSLLPRRSYISSGGNRGKRPGTELQETVSRGAAPHPAKGQGPLDLQYFQWSLGAKPREGAKRSARVSALLLWPCPVVCSGYLRCCT